MTDCYNVLMVPFFFTACCLHRSLHTLFFLFIQFSLVKRSLLSGLLHVSLAVVSFFPFSSSRIPSCLNSIEIPNANGKQTHAHSICFSLFLSGWNCFFAISRITSGNVRAQLCNLFTNASSPESWLIIWLSVFDASPPGFFSCFHLAVGTFPF